MNEHHRAWLENVRDTCIAALDGKRKDEELSRELWRELDDEHSVMVLDDTETKNWGGETREWLQLNY